MTLGRLEEPKVSSLVKARTFFFSHTELHQTRDVAIERSSSRLRPAAKAARSTRSMC